MAEGSGLVPFERHGADLGLLEESAAELVRLSNQAIDQEAATMTAFSPAAQGWEGIAAPELRSAPDGVQQDAFEVSSAVAWGSVPLRTWAASVAEFNRRAAYCEAECAAEMAAVPMPDNPAGSPSAALAVDSARGSIRLRWQQEWRNDYETYIVDGAETVARMYREGPTEENLRAAGHNGIPFSTSGALFVLPQLWHDANMSERADEAIEVANRILAGGEPSTRDLERLDHLLAEYGGDRAFAHHLLTELGPRGLLDLTANVSGILRDDEAIDLDGRDVEIAALLGTIQAGLGVTLATATSRPVSGERYELREGWEEELLEQGEQRFGIEGGAHYPYGFQVLGVLLSSPEAEFDAGFLNRTGTAMLDFELAHHGSGVWIDTAVDYSRGRLNWIDGYGDDAPYGHDPMGGLMVALGNNPEAAREFFLTGRTDDGNPRVEYLVNERAWDPDGSQLDPEPGAMRGLAHLGDALESATHAEFNPDAQRLVGDIVRTVAAEQDLHAELRRPFGDITIRWIDNVYNAMEGADEDTQLVSADVAPFLLQIGRDPDTRIAVTLATTDHLIGVLDDRFEAPDGVGWHGEHVADRGWQLATFAGTSAEMLRALDVGGSDERFEEVRADQRRVENWVSGLTTWMDLTGPVGTVVAGAGQAGGADDSIVAGLVDAEAAGDDVVEMRRASVDSLMTAYWKAVSDHGGPASHFDSGPNAELYRAIAGGIEDAYLSGTLPGVRPTLDD
jgi:hypothetical protein